MSRAAVASGLRAGTAATRAVSDQSLALRAIDGDQGAFAAIFDRHHQSLYRYCLALVGDAQDAQDALQNTMIKVLRALPGEQRRIELKPWLYRIAHNESIELLRRRRETRPLDLELAAAGSGPAEEAVARERLRGLIADLGELPQRQRGALVMRELSGLDFAEIAVALGTSPAVVRQTLYEARMSLRQMDEGRRMSCETVTRALSDGDGRVARRRDLRAHLHSCSDCRGFREEIESRERDLAVLAPLPAVAAAGLLQGLLGGNGAAAGGGLGSAVGGGAAKSLGASAAFKGVATVAVVAAIGVGAADRGGLIDAGLPGGDSAQPTRAQPATSAGLPAARPIRSGSGSGAIGAAAVPASRARDARRIDGSAVAGPDASRIADPGTSKAIDPTGSQVADPGISRVAGPPAGTEKTASAGGQSNPEDAPAPGSGAEPVAKPHGKGHEKEKQLPSAAAHGQETAESHKNAHGESHQVAESGSDENPGHPAHPAKPAHPAPPSSPSAEEASPPPSAPASESHGNGHGKGPPQDADGEEAPPAP